MQGTFSAEEQDVILMKILSTFKTQGSRAGCEI